jgi:hypothetical protein
MRHEDASDSSGMLTKPNHSIWFCAQGTPCTQGLTLSGISP